MEVLLLPETRVLAKHQSTGMARRPLCTVEKKQQHLSFTTWNRVAFCLRTVSLCFGFRSQRIRLNRCWCPSLLNCPSAKSATGACSTEVHEESTHGKRLENIVSLLDRQQHIANVSAFPSSQKNHAQDLLGEEPKKESAPWANAQSKAQAGSV